jgi:ABC-type glutathione transport system ATPase component
MSSSLQSRGEQLLLEARGLCKTHMQGRWWQRQFPVVALDHVDLALHVGKTLALVGKSGAGKTTLAMCLVGLEQPDAGEIVFQGINISRVRGKAGVRIHREIQLIFQDSAEAFNPRMQLIETIEEPLLLAGQDRRLRRQQALNAMDKMGLPRSWHARKPHELSGGQRQRLAIARALVLQPKALILDEALAGLDLSIRGQISNLLLDLQAEHGLSYLYISHDLQHVAQFADEVAILHQGRITKRVDASQIIDEATGARSSPFGAPTPPQTSAARAGG